MPNTKSKPNQNNYYRFLTKYLEIYKKFLHINNNIHYQAY